MADYKLKNDKLTGSLNGIIKTADTAADTAYIPLDTDNTEYQEYLEWVAKGNTAEAAD